MTRRILFALAAAGLLLAALPAMAQSLGEAKEQGLLGERPDGYLGAVKSVPGPVRDLMDGVNNQRRGNYDDIARRQGTSRTAVEAVAGEKLQRMTPSGQYIMDSSGSWRRK
jgi:uncharacterized protein YdbL (DUF1318 family)